jgi:hypothetical protein
VYDKNILGIIFCSLYLHKCKQVSLRQRTNNIDMKIAQLDGSTSASKLRRMMMMMMITADLPGCVAKRDEGRNKLQTWVRQVWLEQTL